MVYSTDINLAEHPISRQPNLMSLCRVSNKNSALFQLFDDSFQLLPNSFHMLVIIIGLARPEEPPQSIAPGSRYHMDVQVRDALTDPCC